MAEYIKARKWNGKDLKGEWRFEYKIDGVRMLRDENDNPISRSGKPLYNLDDIDKGIRDAEVYRKDWETSISMVKTKIGGTPVQEVDVYDLEDEANGLFVRDVTNPTSEFIMRELNKAVKSGFEGLILRQGDSWIKVKPVHTADVRVTGIFGGTGQFEGMLGGFRTPYGQVGTGFTNDQRVELNDEGLVETIIEVAFMEMTKDNKFRHPRFIRLRPDKNEESL